jgi:eukaryotic translation initiation factor 2C
VDRGITTRGVFDFYLVAHQAIKGTARPAHYIVLRDQNNFKADTIQRFTHELCYTFARATCSVSLCPPAYYADILCERGRSYLHREMKGAKKDEKGKTDEKGRTAAPTSSVEVHERLANRMYFI